MLIWTLNTLKEINPIDNTSCMKITYGKVFRDW